MSNINERIAEAEKVLNSLNLTEREKRIMELREKKIRDDKNIRETAIEEAKEEIRELK